MLYWTRERYSIINVMPIMLLQGCSSVTQCISVCVFVCVRVKENDSHKHIECRHNCHLFFLHLFVVKQFNFPQLLQNPKGKGQEHNVPTSLKENGYKKRRRSRGNEVENGHCLCRRKLSLIKSINNTGTQKDD